MKIKLFAFDLDGTLTQHKTPLLAKNRAALEKLARKSALCMVGAGMCRRIFEQMKRFPIDIIGNYGMQTAIYNSTLKDIEIIEDNKVSTDRDSVERRITELRKRYGYTDFKGDNVEYHSSGCITFPLLGTKAEQKDKLAFDPDRKKRRAFYGGVKKLFPEYTVFIGGSSSFDMAPKPYNKYYALNAYCNKLGIAHNEVVFFGDDYGEGGNDESIYLSDFGFEKVENYSDFPKIMKKYTEE